jgi:hypothetical protein
MDMSPSLPRPTLTVYRRARCEACDEARVALQAVLEDRAMRGEIVPRVREVDVDADAALAARYGALVPVVAVSGHELALVTSGRQLRAFLDRVLPALA